MSPNNKQKSKEGLRLLEEVVLEILRDAGNAGMKATDIARKAGIPCDEESFGNAITSGILKIMKGKGLASQKKVRGPWFYIPAE